MYIYNCSIVLVSEASAPSDEKVSAQAPLTVSFRPAQMSVVNLSLAWTKYFAINHIKTIEDEGEMI